MAEDASVFVGPVEQLSGRFHAQLGTLVVILRNGQPVSVLAPGKRILRGLGAPLVGDLQLVQIRTSPVTLHQTVRNIPTQDLARPGEAGNAWEVPSLSLRLSVQINPDGDYSAFADYVRRHGAGFGSAFVNEIISTLDESVRSSFASHDHDYLFTASLTKLIVPDAGRRTIANGAALLVSAAVEDVVWSPHFLAIRSGVASANATRAIRINQTNVDVAVMENELESFEALSRRLGIASVYLANPDRLMVDRAQATDLMMKLLEPSNRAVLLRTPGLLEGLLERATAGMAAPPQPQRSSTDGGDYRLAPDRPRLGVSTPLELSIDSKLRKTVARVLPQAGSITGIAGAVGGDEGTVVLVSDLQRISDDETVQLTAALAPLMRVHRISVIAIAGAETLEQLVTKWFATVAGPNLTARPFVQDDELTIEVSGDLQEALAAVDALNAVDNANVVVLERLLPYAALTVRLES